MKLPVDPGALTESERELLKFAMAVKEAKLREVDAQYRKDNWAKNRAWHEAVVARERFRQKLSPPVVHCLLAELSWLRPIVKAALDEAEALRAWSYTKVTDPDYVEKDQRMQAAGKVLDDLLEAYRMATGKRKGSIDGDEA